MSEGLCIAEMAKKYKNWTIYKLAQQMGCSPQMLYNWERGRNVPTKENLQKICFTIGCTASELLGF